MNIYELVVLACSLSMDSFSTAVCKGMELNRIKVVYIFLLSFLFALFQSMMPLIGYMLGNFASDLILNLGHLVSFTILSVLGINMIRNSNKYDDTDLSIKTLFILAFAISIDALSVGITFINLDINIKLAIILIFGITFITSIVGVIIGYLVGNRLNKNILILGGLMLIALGIKILIF